MWQVEQSLSNFELREREKDRLGLSHIATSLKSQWAVESYLLETQVYLKIEL